MVDVASTEMLDSDVAVDAAMLMMEQSRLSWEVWIYSILGSVLVGLSGIFPLLVIPLEAGPSLKHGGRVICFSPSALFKGKKVSIFDLTVSVDIVILHSCSKAKTNKESKSRLF